MNSTYIMHSACFLLVLPCAQANMFYDLHVRENFLKTHDKIKQDMENYIRKEAKRISVLKKLLEIHKREHERATENIQIYLKNPINIYILTKRLTTDVHDIQKNILSATDNTQNFKTESDQNINYLIPTEEDLEKTANILSRLQTIYKLDVKDLAEGIMDGTRNHSPPMSVGDCFEMGRILYEDENYENSLPWMLEALRKYKKQKDNALLFTEVDILEYISVTYYYLDDVQSAAIWNKKILELDPTNAPALINMQLYSESIAKNDVCEREKHKLPVENTTEEEEEDVEYEDYCSICRGERNVSQEIAKSLSCYYLTNKHPFLLLARIKVEQLYANPDVFMFYDVISDNESAIIQNMAKQNLYHSLTQERNPIEARISEQAWLRDEDSQVIADISRRVSHFTGFSVATAEPLQVVHYGIGGHYEPHHDSLDNQNSVVGNRLATVLFYISEVAHGGATVFLKLGLRVFPVKNAALFWTNLDLTGAQDLATIHAACPVLGGHKWVATKWIREFGQEFIRPCSI